jgi:hypothetical protein
LKLSIATKAWLLPCCCTATALMAGGPLEAQAYTAVFTLTGQGTSQTTFSTTNNGLTLTIDGLNGGSFFLNNANGLCAYWAENSGTGNTACNNIPTNRGYNGLKFTASSSSNVYNVRLTAISTGGRNAAGNVSPPIVSTFTGATGSNQTVTQVFQTLTPTCDPSTNSINANCNNYTFTTPILVDSQNQITLCSTPDINSLSCTGNILNSTNGNEDPSFYTIKSMTFTYDTPGPLPLLGAGAAFGWSRRLRRRIKRHGTNQPD